MHWESSVVGEIMFRLTVLLGAGIFLAMLIGGQDRGQKRFGLMAQPGSQEAPVAVAALPEPALPQDVVAASFAPEKPLMAAPEMQAVVDVAAQPEGKLFYVASDTANVREGPGKDHAVIEKLLKGESVLVVSQGEGPDGWSLIRIEGDGVEGYVASRLLTE
jgi:Bacterial SH3 domain